MWQRVPRGGKRGRRAGGPTPSSARGARTAVGRQARHGLRRAGHLCRRGQRYHRRCQGSKPRAASCGLWYEHGPATRLSRSWFYCRSWQRRRWQTLPAKGTCAPKAKPWPDGRGADWHVRRGSSAPRCQLMVLLVLRDVDKCWLGAVQRHMVASVRGDPHAWRTNWCCRFPPKVKRMPLAQTDEALRPSWLWTAPRRVTGQSCMAG